MGINALQPDATNRALEGIDAAYDRYIQKWKSVEQSLDVLVAGHVSGEGVVAGPQETHAPTSSATAAPGLFSDEFREVKDWKINPEALFDLFLRGGVVGHKDHLSVLGALGIREDFRKAEKIANYTDVLVGMTLIRYVDDFLDKVLWPKTEFSKLDDEERFLLTARVDRFLAGAAAVASTYGVTIPFQLAELPRAELFLELNPSQASFDSMIIPLVMHKSADTLYFLGEIFPDGGSVEQRLGIIKRGLAEAEKALSNGLRDEDKKLSIDVAQYSAQCLMDLARSFDDASAADKDFKLGRYIRGSKGAIRPTILVRFTATVIRTLEDNISRMSWTSHETHYVTSILRAFIRSLEKSYVEGGVGEDFDDTA